MPGEFTQQLILYMLESVKTWHIVRGTFSMNDCFMIHMCVGRNSMCVYGKRVYGKMACVCAYLGRVYGKIVCKSWNNLEQSCLLLITHTLGQI